ncbi:MAG: carboxypeptidase regulatory-like domain-containing protein [Gemmatimonadales bacterium]|nr:carboxypeptidase regulatory-like domain-containing protein [Gemmatimonadales bacterium]
MTERAIADLTAIGQTFPETAAQLSPVVDHLAGSLAAPGGELRLTDRCHARSTADGAAAFDGARSAVLAIGPLLSAGLPAFATATLTSVRTELVDAYTFLADAAFQEARALAPGGLGNGGVRGSFLALVSARAQLTLGQYGPGLASLKNAWTLARQATPAAPTTGPEPKLSTLAPDDGALLLTLSGNAGGRVQVNTGGTTGPEDVSVQVNGTVATVANRAFEAKNLLFSPGVNAVVTVAKATGGQLEIECRGVRVDLTPRPRLGLITGDAQTGAIGSTLPQPLKVRAFSASGQGVAGVPVVFRVDEGDGRLGGDVVSKIVTTDAAGYAQTTLKLGTRVGPGSDRVRATAAGYAGGAAFSATATAGAAVHLYPVTGENQAGGVGLPLPAPLVVMATDAANNPKAGVPVTFTVEAGGGSFSGGASQVVATNADGRAAATLTLGPAADLEGHRVSAAFPGLTSDPVVFTASAYVLGDPAATRVSGVVLDNQDEPVPGVTLRIHGTSLQTTTDAEGQFELLGTPVGHVLLDVDASTTTRPGTWANLEFEMHLLAGVDNSLPRPIYILPLDLASGKVAGGPEDVTISVPDVPGLELTVLANSATFPGGAKTGLVSMTAVHADKIPMAPGLGMQPRLVVTIQPAGAHFDPPAIFSLPNVDGLAPGTVTEMYSFDHDLGQFVSIGTGTVSPDGAVVRSDPGFGVVKAGWHWGAPGQPGGQGAALDVTILTPKPLLLCVGSNDSKLIQAVGTPAQDSVYSWTLSDPGVVTLNPSGFNLCANQPTCNTLATATGAGGKTTATVTMFNTVSNLSDLDFIDIVSPVVKVLALAPQPLVLGNDLTIDYEVVAPAGFAMDALRLEVVNANGILVYETPADATAGVHSMIWPGVWNQAPHSGAFANPANGPYEVRLIGTEAGADCGEGAQLADTHLVLAADLVDVPAPGTNPTEAAGLADLTAALKVVLKSGGGPEFLFLAPTFTVDGPDRWHRHLVVEAPGLDALPDGDYDVLFRDLRDEIGNFADADGNPANGIQEIQFSLSLW